MNRKLRAVRCGLICLSGFKDIEDFYWARGMILEHSEKSQNPSVWYVAMVLGRLVLGLPWFQPKEVHDS